MSNAPAASGLSFGEQEKLIERVATAKAYQYKSIGYYDFEDIKQEVRIKCWKAIKRYDPKCGANLFVFLCICAENRLRDIRRSVKYKNNKPCLRCPFWNKDAFASGCHDCLVYSDKMQCDKYYKHEQLVHAKLSASEPSNIDNEEVEDNYYSSYIEKLEIIEVIECNLPDYIIPIYSKLKEHNFNLKSLKAKERSLLISTLRGVVDKSDFI